MKKLAICTYPLLGESKDIKKLINKELDKIFLTDNVIEIYIIKRSRIDEAGELFIQVIKELAVKYMDKAIRIYEWQDVFDLRIYTKTYPKNESYEALNINKKEIIKMSDVIVTNLYKDLYKASSYEYITAAEKRGKVIYINEAEKLAQIYNIIETELTDIQAVIVKERQKGLSYRKISETAKLNESRVIKYEEQARIKLRQVLKSKVLKYNKEL